MDHTQQAGRAFLPAFQIPPGGVIRSEEDRKAKNETPPRQEVTDGTEAKQTGQGRVAPFSL